MALDIVLDLFFRTAELGTPAFLHRVDVRLIFTTTVLSMFVWMVMYVI